MAQVGIAISTLGIVLALIGMFPGVTGLDATAGIGVLQIVVILTGFTLLIGGALLYVQSTYYPGVRHNLAQQIAVRLSASGLLFATIAGLGDLLGFGSHPPGPNGGPFLGYLQAAGLIGGFVVASAGVILFALLGPEEKPDDADE
jgi:amino acid transporter